MVVTLQGTTEASVRMKISSDYESPLAYTGDVLNVGLSSLLLATENMLTSDQRRKLFGIPGLKYLGRNFYHRLVHSEFNVDLAFGSFVSTGAGTWWSLGFIETGVARYPLAAILFNTETKSISDMKLMKGVGLVPVPPAEDCIPSLREAYDRMAERCRNRAEVPIQKAEKKVPRREAGAKRRVKPVRAVKRAASRSNSRPIVLSDSEPLQSKPPAAKCPRIHAPLKYSNLPDRVPLPRPPRAAVPAEPIADVPLRSDTRRFEGNAAGVRRECERNMESSNRPSSKREASDFRAFLLETLSEAEALASRQRVELRHEYDRELHRLGALSKFDRFFN